MQAEHIELMARVITGLTFLTSATGKLRDRTAFVAAVEDFDILPRRWAHATATGVIGVELALVVAMSVGGPVLLVGFVAAAALLLAFTAALASALRRHSVVSCNCFGAATTRLSGYDLARNAALTAVALAGALAAAADHDRGLPPAEIAVLALASTGITLLALNVADVARTLRRPFGVPDAQ
jgi:hypothetical protein